MFFRPLPALVIYEGHAEVSRHGGYAPARLLRRECPDQAHRGGRGNV